MNLVALRLPDDMSHKITIMAKKLGRSKSYLIRKAVEIYMKDYIDYQIALERLDDKDDRIISSKEMRMLLGK